MFQSTIFIRMRSVTNHAYGSANGANCEGGQVKAHKVRKMGTFFLSKRDCAVQQVLKVGTRSPQSTFTAFY